MGSMILWHEAHVGFDRCSSMRLRSDSASRSTLLSTFSGGTFAGGFGGGVPRMFSRTHLPRATGDVRVGNEVTVRMLPCPSNPRRGVFANETRRNWLP